MNRKQNSKWRNVQIRVYINRSSVKTFLSDILKEEEKCPKMQMVIINRETSKYISKLKYVLSQWDSSSMV